MNRISLSLFICGVLLASGSAGLSSCSKSAGADSTKVASESFTVQTTTVQLRPITATLKVTGSLEGTKEAVVQSETQGRILAISKTIGDRVGAGTPLVKVDDELKVIALQQATAQRLSAEAALDKAKLDDDRNQQLLKENAVTKSQTEMSAVQVKSAEAMLKGAQSVESLAKRQLADATIKAPFAGVISNRFVNQGETVSPGTKVETLIDDSRMKFKMFINELDVANLKLHDKVVVTVDAISGKTFDGTIADISAKSDQTRSYEVDVELPNTNHDLKSGMFARAEIQRPSLQDVPSVPNEAVIYNGAIAQAYIVENGIAHLRTIKLGASSGDNVEVVDGLKPGAEVVTYGQNQLHDGAKIRK